MKALERLKADAVKRRQIASKHKENGLMESFRLNLMYAYGLEDAIEAVEKELKHND